MPLEPDRPRRQPGVLRGQLRLRPTKELLDTHALLWWLTDPQQLSPIAQTAIDDPAPTMFVRAASGWEIATNVRLGRLPNAERVLQDLPSLLHQHWSQSLSVQLHRDPFDRLLAAFPSRLLW